MSERLAQVGDYILVSIDFAAFVGGSEEEVKRLFTDDFRANASLYTKYPSIRINAILFNGRSGWCNTEAHIYFACDGRCEDKDFCEDETHEEVAYLNIYEVKTYKMVSN